MIWTGPIGQDCLSVRLRPLTASSVLPQGEELTCLTKPLHHLLFERDGELLDFLSLPRNDTGAAVLKFGHFLQLLFVQTVDLLSARRQEIRFTIHFCARQELQKFHL